MKYAIIPADATKPVEIKDGDTSLDLWQMLVHGYIEGVSVQPTEKTPALRMYCNEEGRIDGLPANGRATALRVIATQGMFHPDGLLICGDVVVIGGYDKYGEDTGLSREQEQYLQKLVKA
jgi:hypothetical protein